MTELTVTHVGGPTALLRLGGLALLTDPTFDAPGEYPAGNRSLVKLAGPARRPKELGPIDAVLLSHDQHWDNLDRAGRELLASVPVTLSTPAAAGRLAEVTGLAPWAEHRLTLPDGGALTVTAVPARHGPVGCEPLLGDVTGFVLRADGLPTVYVSGDNAATDLVAGVVERAGPIDVAVLFAGAARAPQLVPEPLTLTCADAVVAARLLDPAVIVAVHNEGWAHFTEGPAQLRAAFAAAGLADRLVATSPGEPAAIRLGHQRAGLLPHGTGGAAQPAGPPWSRNGGRA